MIIKRKTHDEIGTPKDCRRCFEKTDEVHHTKFSRLTCHELEEE